MRRRSQMDFRENRASTPLGLTCTPVWGDLVPVDKEGRSTNLRCTRLLLAPRPPHCNRGADARVLHGFLQCVRALEASGRRGPFRAPDCSSPSLQGKVFLKETLESERNSEGGFRCPFRSADCRSWMWASDFQCAAGTQHNTRRGSTGTTATREKRRVTKHGHGPWTRQKKDVRALWDSRDCCGSQKHPRY